MDCNNMQDMTVKITVKESDVTYEMYSNIGENLFHILRFNGIFLDSFCGGNGKCGKCKVRIIKGKYDYKGCEKDTLRHGNTKNDIRLACLTYVKEDLIINIPGKRISHKILTEYDNTPMVLNPRINILRTEHPGRRLLEGVSITQQIIKEAKVPYKFTLKSLQHLSKCSKSDYISLVIEDNKVLNVTNKPNVTSYGIAIDLGTTTIVLKMVNLLTGEEIGSFSILNPQKQFGADIISRIQYSSNVDNAILTQIIRNCIAESIKQMCVKFSVSNEDIHHIVIAGNTVMLYFLLGISTIDLAQSPFNTVILDKQDYGYYELFRDDYVNCIVTLLPCISAYIGADIIAGMLYCNFQDLNKTVLMVDIGTNGEMVIGNETEIHCTSAAAGPAFEGSNIIHGVGSIDGAINKVYMKEDKIYYDTINGTAPVGICGSGVIDIVANLLDKGILDNKGYLVLDNEKNYVQIGATEAEQLNFYQKDIREVQLAKSAIITGINILIDRFGSDVEEIDTIVISGGFGNSLSINNAVRIGLIPEELKNRVKFIGNGTLGGAVKYILNKDSDLMIEEIMKRTRHYDLNSVNMFSQLFIKNMYFPS